MIKKIIERPVLASVISILIIIAGLISLMRLPVTRFPDIAPPSVRVGVSYPGGNAETVAKSVLLPLEEAINGVENMTYIRSKATNSGQGSINIFFKPGTDPDIAAVNVQNSISREIGELPPEVIQEGISVVKRLSGNIMTINIIAEGEDSPYNETFIQSYSRINVKRELLRVEGVAQASFVGRRTYAMRVWLNPEKLALYGLVPQDITSQINDQNFEAAPGRFGETSEEIFETIIKHKGRFSTPEEYENIVIKSNKDGSILYLRDIARVELGASNLGSDNTVNGKAAATINITQTSDSNAKEIDQNIREVMERISKNFPEGITYEISYSVRNQIDESINQVVLTIIEACILVFIVVFVFLQDLRSTIIPAIAIPVSLIGTFFFLQLLGFSVNVLTMFALVLAIGIVVDDAIVVVEAVHHKMTHSKLPANKATIAAMNEISTAIISITIVMAAVFVPVGFMEGPVGLFYKQFAYTLIFAILISALNALTLSPVLCALMLKPAEEYEDKNASKFGRIKRRVFTAFESGFDAFTNKYISLVTHLLKRKWIPLSALVILLVLTVLMFRSTPSAFIPSEDDSFLTYSLTMPPGSSLHRTSGPMQQVDSILRKHPAVKSVNSISGFNVMENAPSPSFGMGYINLKPIHERGEIQELDALITNLISELSHIPEANINVFARPTVQGFGEFSGLEMIIQDRVGENFTEFNDAADKFIAELNERPEIENAFTTFNANFPQYQMNIDYVKAKNMGVSVQNMMRSVQAYFGRLQSGDFNRFGRQYRIFVQADIPYRTEKKSMDAIFVRNNLGEMVPVNTMVSLEEVNGPEIVNRYNLFNSITINATPADGYSTGDAMNAIEEIAAELPTNYSYEWTGMSLEEKKSGLQTAIIFILSIVFVFFLLAAQYESYWLPFAVLLSIPCGLLGVFVAINLAGIDNNIYVQVSIIMLIGLLAKNAILIVEFAAQKRAQGLSIFNAAVEAARLRIRPIIMTSFAFIAGLIPLMRTVGASAQGNKSVSIGAAGGMLFGVILGIFIIPTLYLIFQTLHEKTSRRLSKNKPVEA
ncbi:efflux RND transporter permease subunit [Cyclobacterium marinum]|uniref:Transporter, hydrophobe/amphiphile efflux-1 (HAE1) family n=1 Tax=Cyclobacterium marinum (strain ATCC 25205 / DSM 745 / LMG 13164 / NCIMB 1802) TaxID=880070 RepID=G0IWA9_CYCMS|nr:efflux RND transporter permease subunit [Cyclobacterium marinum]AEL27097.1 transporter, hydrophobe/amphiphile efflux-1 (HAE1) family [Cyclobacterium marinum DSM 745]|tara:strand:- start:108848 stop:112003 length:3156 start_codon:yes stop_codon:yes gene_type:complete